MHDIDILTLTQRVKNSISLGESHFREFKSAIEGKPCQKQPRKVSSICREIGEALVAFANGDGGELLIGVEDDGSITGLFHCHEDIATMLNAINTHVYANTTLPIKFNQLLTIDGKQILYFSVAKGTEKIYQLPDGRCMRRQDKNTVPISVETLIFERREQLSRSYDRQFVDGAMTTDLDLQLIHTLSNTLLPGMSPEQYLQQLGLGEYVAGGLRLRMASLLLFAKDIAKWAPRCQVRILHVSGTELETGEKYNVISDEPITGNIFSLITNAWQALRPFLTRKVSLGNNAKFEQTYVFPENACKEALINALAHRDYSAQNSTNIYIFDDRLVIENPGELLSTLSISDLRSLKGAHESRNTYVSTILRENAYMRELGEGIKRIFELMEENEFAPPDVTSTNGNFSIVFYNKSIYNQAQKIWLELFKGYDLDINQRRVVVAGINSIELSPNDIYIALGVHDRSKYDKTVTALRIKGILEEICTNARASSIARMQRINKGMIKRFRVSIPSEIPIDKTTSLYNNKIFLYNIPIDCTIDLIKKELSIFGFVIDVIIPKDKYNMQKEFAYVTFESEESALKAIAIKKISIGGLLSSIYAYKPPKRAMT